MRRYRLSDGEDYHQQVVVSKNNTTYRTDSAEDKIGGLLLTLLLSTFVGFRELQLSSTEIWNDILYGFRFECPSSIGSLF